jgi:hypothetical protein
VQGASLEVLEFSTLIGLTRYSSMFDSNGFILFSGEYVGAFLGGGCFLIRRRGLDVFLKI